MNQGWPGQGPWLGQPLNRLSHLWSQPHWSGRIPVPRTEYGIWYYSTYGCFTALPPHYFLGLG